MEEIIIRLAREADAVEILKIYEPYIKDTAITFEYEVPTLDEFKNRIKKISSVYPYLVCLIGGRIVGYAYAYRQKERAAYQWNAELSVYINKLYLRMGIGKALYSCLIEILKLQNVRNIYGGVTIPNPNSEKLHEYFGFQRLATYHNVGYKCDAWQDIILFEKSIGEYGSKPKSILTVQEIDQNLIVEIMNKACAMIKYRPVCP